MDTTTPQPHAARAAHTPTPWKSTKRGSSNAPLILVVDANGKEVANTHGGFRDQSENEANTELIARAVNSHATTLAALHRAANWIKSMDEDFDLNDAYLSVESAIALAEGRT